MFTSTTVAILAALCSAVVHPVAGSSRIIGGIEASKRSYGEYVMILDDKKMLSCGATLIQDNLVLTAAHCLSGVGPKDMYLAKGNIKYDSEKDVLKSADEILKPRKLIIHERYQKREGYDVGIVVLNGTMSAPFASLAARNTKPAAGSTMTAVGFGVNQDYIIKNTETGEVAGLAPPRLYEVNLTLGIAGVAPCPRENMRPNSDKPIDQNQVYSPRELCLLGEYFYTDRNDIGIGLKSACSGDSGGPLFYNGRQYGIAARVLDVSLCSNEFLDPFTIYTKVSAHRKYFIEPLMKKYSKKQ